MREQLALVAAAAPARGRARRSRRSRRSGRRRRRRSARRARASCTGQIGVIRVVERRPDQIVHRRVDDHEVLDLALLEIEHRGQQHAGVADDHAPRLADQRDVEPGERRHRLLRSPCRTRPATADPPGCRGCRARRRCRRSASLMPSLTSARDQLDEPRDRVVERRGLGQLRADVAVDADDLEVRQLRGARGTRRAPRPPGCRTCSS